MKNASLLAIVPLLAGSLLAQANTVPGLDGRLDLVDNLDYYGRRGAAYPNGEAGMAMLNEMCNPGTVVIPWQAAMQPNHPKFGFLIVRESNGRMEQISDRSYCKHAFTSTNYSGPCGTCQNPGTGSVMGIHCADTYGSGNNADRNWLGPADEIDPWLGTWNPIGSYFDQGDPNVGAPNNSDGVRSPSYNGPDDVKNRVTVKETDLITPGANYFYGIHLLHQGEALANRGDNLASRGFTPSWNGSSWSFGNNSVGMVWGSILQHWQGATLDSGSNGNDDGRFFVACKVTPLGGGQFHYEYAVHNVDNSRGGATFRVPVDPAAVVANYSFRDIDNNALNNWIGARQGNEVVFTAPVSNPLNWNTIYNFGFDCNIAPGGGGVVLDEARLGAGALSVTVLSQIPGGVPVAQVTSVGTPCASCASSFYESWNGGFDLANSSMTLSFAGGAYTAGPGTSAFVAPTGTSLALSDDSEATVNLPFTLAYPGGTTTQLHVCSNGFLSPAASNGTTFDPSIAGLLGGAPRWAALWHDLNPGAGGAVRFDSTPTMVRITWVAVPNYGGSLPNTFQVQFEANGSVHMIWQALDVGGNGHLVGWSRGGNASDPGNRDISATLPQGWSLCANDFQGLSLSASARPVVGTTLSLDTTNLPAGSLFAALLLSPVQFTPAIDLTSQGMPGCFQHGGADAVHLMLAPGAVFSQPLSIPNSVAFSGVTIVGQSYSYSPPLTPAGVIASNALLLLIGQI